MYLFIMCVYIYRHRVCSLYQRTCNIFNCITCLPLNTACITGNAVEYTVCIYNK